MVKASQVEAQFLEAYDAYSDAIFRHCYYRVFDREKAKDIMQDAFMRTWEYLSKGEQVDNLRAFLYRVANNLIIDDVRKKKEMSLDKLQEEGFDPGIDETERIQSRVDEHYVLSVLETVEQPYRDAIIMRYIDELKPAEIAELTGESPNTISVRVHRGLNTLRSRLNDGSRAR